MNLLIFKPESDLKEAVFKKSFFFLIRDFDHG